MRVFLCDDVGAFRALMRFTLEEDPRIEVVGEAADGCEGVDGVERAAARRRPARPGDAGARRLRGDPAHRRALARTTIVALSGFTAERMAAPCIESGAYAYLEKGEDVAVIREAVLQAAIAA